MSKRYAVLIALAAVALAAIGCGGSSSSGGGGGSGGFLRIGDASSKIDSTNPFVSQNFFGFMTFRYNYPHLVQYDAQDKDIVPDFAKSVSSSPDGRTWTFDLHDGAKWSDGQPLTSADVKWSIDTTLKYQSGPSALLAGLVANVASVTAPSPTRVVITYKQAAANSQSLLANFPILPQHVWASHLGADGKGLTTWTNPAPIVSGGPYQLEKYTPDVSMLFKANPSYYGAKPKLSGFGLQFFGSNDAMVSALKQNQLDVGLEVPPLAVKTLQQDQGVSIGSPPGPDETAIIVNSNPKKTNHKELQIPAVRRAMSMALDRKKLVDIVTDGTGVAATTLIPPTVPKWSADGKLPAFPRDVAGANKLLDSLGFKRGPDGIRVANGQKMIYDFNYCACYGDRPQATIQADLKEIGIGLNVKAADPKAYIGAFSEPNNKFLDYDLGMYDDQAHPDPSAMLGDVSCTQRGNANFSYYCDPRYEKMFQQQASLLDEQKRIDLVVKMQAFIRDQAPWIPMYDPPVPVAWRSNVKDFRPSGLIIDTLSTAQLTDVSISK